MNYRTKVKEGFGRYLDRTFSKIASVYLSAFKKHGIDLSIEQWVILQQIYLLKEKASQAEIAKMSYRNRATTSRVIGGLTKKGLVKKERFNGDLKRFKLILTEEGTKIVEKVLPVVQNLRSIGYKHIKEEDFETFLAVLDQIWQNYEEAGNTLE